MRSIVLWSVLFTLLFPAYTQAQTQAMRTMHATWYGDFHHKQPMASGKPFDMNNPTTVAHKTLPLGTKLRVINPMNGKSLTVTVSDRGPYTPGRDLDLSKAGAQVLGFIAEGKANLLVHIVNEEHAP